MKGNALVSHKTVKKIDTLPTDGLVKLNNFRNYCKVYFRNQTVAGISLKVHQTTFNRYLSGDLFIPQHIAERMEELTQGAVTKEELYFDYRSYIYDAKNKEKQGGTMIS